MHACISFLTGGGFQTAKACTGISFVVFLFCLLGIGISVKVHF
jgi:hypothetical protein